MSSANGGRRKPKERWNDDEAHAGSVERGCRRKGLTRIATVNLGWSEPFNSEQNANARLIAAAPDLLEALQWYEAKAVQMGRAAIDQDSKLLLELMKEIAVEYGAQARAAIAKATGDQP